MGIKEKILRLGVYCFKIVSESIGINKILFVQFKSLKISNRRTWLRDIFIFFGIPLILASIIINSFHGHFNLITIDSIFVAIAIFTPIMFSFMLSIFSIDEELLMNEKDYQIIKKFNNDVSFIIIICIITIFLLLLKASLYDYIGIFDSVLDFFIVWGLLIIGFNLLKILDNLNFIVNERIREFRQKKK